MKDTCNFEECYFGKLFDKAEQCPNFMQSGWKEKEGDEIKIIKDCAPKRTFLMLQELSNRLIGLQKAQEEQRNKSDKVLLFAKRVIQNAEERLNVSQNKNPPFPKGEDTLRE